MENKDLIEKLYEAADLIPSEKVFNVIEDLEKDKQQYKILHNKKYISKKALADMTNIIGFKADFLSKPVIITIETSENEDN